MNFKTKSKLDTMNSYLGGITVKDNPILNYLLGKLGLVFIVFTPVALIIFLISISVIAHTDSLGEMMLYSFLLILTTLWVNVLFRFIGNILAIRSYAQIKEEKEIKEKSTLENQMLNTMTHLLIISFIQAGIALVLVYIGFTLIAYLSFLVTFMLIPRFFKTNLLGERYLRHKEIRLEKQESLRNLAAIKIEGTRLLIPIKTVSLGIPTDVLDERNNLSFKVTLDQTSDEVRITIKDSDNKPKVDIISRKFKGVWIENDVQEILLKSRFIEGLKLEFYQEDTTYTVKRKNMISRDIVIEKNDVPILKTEVKKIDNTRFITIDVAELDLDVAIALVYTVLYSSFLLTFK